MKRASIASIVRRSLAGLAALGLAACSSGGTSPSIPLPAPAPVGEPLPGSSGTVLDAAPAGGTLATGRLTVFVPPGAFAASVQVTARPIVNTAPSGLGPAYRLAPEGQRFVKPVTLTFRADGLASVESLAIAYQDARGYWARAPGVLRNRAAGLVSVATTHFSDWALVPADPTKDLAGSFLIHSTVSTDVDLTAVGNVTLTYLGEDAVERAYFMNGTVTLQPVSYQGNACTPAAETQTLLGNVAEAFVNPAHLAWGASAQWSLTCGPTTASADLFFDTYGITHLGCTRGDTPGGAAPLTTADAASGDYTIDCAAKRDGTLRATWSFTRCSAPCVSSSPCATSAATTCSPTGPVCTVLTTAAVGTACTPAAGGAGVCDAAGACNPCVEGATCTSASPCVVSAAVACASGAPVCTDGALQPVGTACTVGSTAGVCDAAGACVPCDQGASCVSANPCAVTATIECTSGAPVCTVATLAAVGAACTSGTVVGVCDATGSCTACSQGAACPASGSCAATATTECTSGAPVCVETFATVGTPCTSGTTAGVCTGTSSTCNPCDAGASCTSSNACATSAAIACASGAPVCTDATLAADATPCATVASGVCLAGACTACTSGTTSAMSCVPADPCHVGSLDCGDATALPPVPPGCVDTGVAVPDATPCAHDGTGAPVVDGTCVSGVCQ